MIKTIQTRPEFFIQFSEEECAELNIQEGEKFTVKELNGEIHLERFSTMEFDLSELPRETLQTLIAASCDQDVSVNEVIGDILKKVVAENE